MESVHHEKPKATHVAATARDRIVDFHDRHLKVSPVAEKGIAEFTQVSGLMKSEKGKAAMERMKPHIREWAKNAEVGAATADMVAGLLGAAVSVDGIIGSRLEKAKINRMSHHLEPDLRSVGSNTMGMELRPRVIKGMKGLAGAGLFWGLRPFTRLTYYVGIPTARRIALTVDSILLRRETKLKTNQVLVGRAKA